MIHKEISNNRPIFVPTPVPEKLEKKLAAGLVKKTELGLEKRCCRCGEFWPMDSKFYQCNRRTWDGLMAYCKACYEDMPSVQTRRAKCGQYPDPGYLAMIESASLRLVANS